MFSKIVEKESPLRSDKGAHRSSACTQLFGRWTRQALLVAASWIADNSWGRWMRSHMYLLSGRRTCTTRERSLRATRV